MKDYHCNTRLWSPVFGKQSTMTGILLFLQLLTFISFAVATPLQKRATQVSLISWKFNNNVLSGTIKVCSQTCIWQRQQLKTLQVQNIAYQKVVNIYYAIGSSWSNSQVISAAWSAQGTDGYETWAFSGTATGATQFYIKYDVSGTS
jgi:alpha-amylase